MLLAYAPHDVQEQVLAEPLVRFTDKTITSAQQLRRVLTEVRRTGVAVSDGQITLDALSVAAPIRDPQGEVAASISLVVRTNGTDPLSLAAAVRAAARGVSRVLRGSPARPEPTTIDDTA
ncbi:IclR family transcriptional regulator domain-containing protein [Fodinicola feengrottensis]|uniref:IclR family transcriptional regulator domain-containing protein n=1 Tax=Fodinicola feengrottensis TaxID=435914 RepID=UPI0024415D80|nr:IclR family transcriptional regulator C-terminal domain-containing protein [Fodinicola feengrottensis]